MPLTFQGYENANNYYVVAMLAIILATVYYQRVDDNYKPLSQIDNLWTKATLFVALSLIITIPRLFIDAVSPFPQTSHYYWTSSKEVSVTYAVFYVWQETFLSLKLQRLIAHWGVSVCGPDVANIAGMEMLFLSILAWELDVPFAWAFFMFHLLGLWVHQPIKKLWKGTSAASLSEELRLNLDVGLWTYLLLHGSRYASAAYLRKLMVGVTWAGGLFMVFAFFGMIFLDNWEQNLAATTDSSGKLCYKELESPTSFRLLRVHRSRKFNDPIRCELLEITSIPDGAAHYRAVSYRWDTSQGKIGQISLNGETLRVYPNIETILRKIRSRIWNQHIWIDQLCIDQDNASEKSAQVAVMGQIYQNAMEVKVCLPVAGIAPYSFWKELFGGPGSSPRESEIRDAGALVRRLSESRLLQDYTPGHERGDLLSYAPLQHWKALADLLEQPWFQRMWMIQEIGMANDFITVHYGPEEISWEDFVLAMAVLARSELRRFSELLPTDTHAKRDFPAIENVLIMENMRNEAERMPLFETLILCQRFEATQPVDKIYALLGLSSKEDPVAQSIKVDYSSSVYDAFVSLAATILKQVTVSEQFRMLRFAGKGRSRIPNLPSFVPDWSIRANTSSLEHRNAEMDFEASPMKDCLGKLRVHRCKRKGHKVLTFQGFSIDHVKFLVDLSELPSAASPTPFLDALRTSQKAKEPYFTNQSHEEVFWRTIIVDTHPLKRPAPEDYWRHWQSTFRRFDELCAKNRDLEEDKEFQDLCRTLEYISSPDMIFIHSLATDIFKHRSSGDGDFRALLRRSDDYSVENDPRATQGRQLCVTEHGYMGLVPKNSMIGDAIVILHGAKSPHVLRETRLANCKHELGTSPCYQLIGEAYIHGMMHNTEDSLRGYTETDFPII